jgi:hypothetical protein
MKIRFKASELFLPNIRHVAFLFDTMMEFDQWLLGDHSCSTLAFIRQDTDVINTVYYMDGIRHHSADGGVHSYAFRWYNTPRTYEKTRYHIWAVHHNIWTEVVN